MRYMYKLGRERETLNLFNFLTHFKYDKKQKPFIFFVKYLLKKI